MVDLLLDSTFILPTLGIEVQEVTEKDMKKLSNLSDRIKIHCCYVSMIEVLSKVARTLAKKKDGAETVKEGLRSLFESGVYRWINPDTDAYDISIEMKIRGHQDMIDNLLYSTALSNDLHFLSLDDDLRQFLEKNGYDVSLIVSPRTLEKSI